MARKRNNILLFSLTILICQFSFNQRHMASDHYYITIFVFSLISGHSIYRYVYGHNYALFKKPMYLHSTYYVHLRGHFFTLNVDKRSILSASYLLLLVHVVIVQPLMYIMLQTMIIYFFRRDDHRLLYLSLQ